MDLAPRLVFPIADPAEEPAVGGGQELHGRFGGDGGVVVPELHRTLVDAHATGAGERRPGNLADGILAAGQIDPQFHHRIARLVAAFKNRPSAWSLALGRYWAISTKRRRGPEALLADVLAYGQAGHAAFIVNRQQALGIEVFFGGRTDEVVDHGVGFGLLEFHLRRTDGRTAAKAAWR